MIGGVAGLNSLLYPFNGVALSDQQAFHAYKLAYRQVLDTRYAYELALISQPQLARPGVCPSTGKPTLFISDLPENSSPDWRHQQVDNSGVDMKHRSAIHCMLARSHSRQLDNVQVFFSNRAAVNLLSGQVTQLTESEISRFDAGDGNVISQYDTIVLVDEIHKIKNIEQTLLSLSNALKTNGRIFISTAFHYETETSQFDTEWKFGWDLLKLLNNNGYRNATAITFWTPEFGYLGPFNFIIEATKN